jgi:feruloyl esterase
MLSSGSRFARAASTIGVALAALYGVEASAGRANPGGFANAAQSLVPYTETPYAAVKGCSEMSGVSNNGVTLTAQLITASGPTPEHCRIRGTIPAEIGFDINLPTRWNGRLWMYGNGGFAGEDADSPNEASARTAGLVNGFATARNDTGHLSSKEPLGTFGYNRLDKIIDHAYRAVHETATLAKTIISQYYGRSANYSYFDGCSTGGREGMMEASRYPHDFDGILAGAPTLSWSKVMMKGLSNQLALDSAPTLSPDKLQTAFQSVLDKCDAQDGLRDGLIADPRTCNFNPRGDLPRCGDSPPSAACFTKAEIDALDTLQVGPPIKPKFPQNPSVYDNSTQRNWIFSATPGGKNILTIFGESYFKYFAFIPEQDPNYDWHAFDFRRDPERMALIDSLLNPEPDLAAFNARNGKVLSYWGWSDAALNPIMGYEYYNAVVKRLGLEETQSFYRLFFIPGVAHCSGGYGPGTLDGMTPLIEWVELGKAPERLPAQRVSAGVTVYNRTYCPYPQATVYESGDSEKPENWSCKKKNNPGHDDQDADD